MGKRSLRDALFVLLSAALLVTVLAVPALAEVTTKTHSTEYNGKDYKLVYDYTYYTTHVHSELAGKSDDAVLKYFVTKGMKKGEQAIATFSVKSYRNANQDLRKKYKKNYQKYFNHYMKYGWRQSSRKNTVLGYDKKIKDPVTTYKDKNYSKVYNFNYYVAHNKYVRRKFALDDFGAIEYFVTKGMKKKQQASANFNVQWYYNANQNLRWKYCTDWVKFYNYYQRTGYRKGAVKICTKLKNPLTWYKKNGKKIDLSAIYDFKYYCKHNSAASKYWKTQNDGRAVRHFVKNGLKFGKQGKKGVTRNNETYRALVKKFFPKGTSVQYDEAQRYSSSTNYLIMLNQARHLVSIFEGYRGHWTLIKEFPCCVGNPATPTPTGEYTIGIKGLCFDTEGSGRCWYYSQILGNYLFHSQIYDQSPSPTRIIDGSMGVSCSHGCVRLALANALYIYNHIPSGTKVVSYNRPW